MKIVRELSKAELNIGSRGVSFNSSSEGLGFGDILSILEIQGQGKEAPTVKKEHKDISPLDSSLLASFFAYWSLNSLLEVNDVKVNEGPRRNPNIFPNIFVDHTSTSSTAHSSQQSFSMIHYASSGVISDEDYAGPLLNPALTDEPTNNLNTSPQSFGGNVEGSQKININTVENIRRNADESLQIGKDKTKEENPYSHSMEIPHQRFEYEVESVQEVKSTKPSHTFNETKSLYIKLEEGEFRMRIVRDTISVRMDFREDFRLPTAQEVQSLIESLSKVGFRIEMLSLNGKNLQWEFRQWQEDRRGSKTREVSHPSGKEKPEFSLYL